MSTTNTYRLLLLLGSLEETERVIALFRDAGHAVRAHRITSEQDFNEYLEDDEWDLLIGDDQHADLGFEQACHIINDGEYDIPSLLLVNEHNPQTILAGMNKGAQDVVAIEATELLLLQTLREIRSYRARIKSKKLEAEVLETNQQVEQLLSTSNDAIAYIVDGMHIEANKAYAETFGFEDPDDFVGLSVIDLVAATDQERFKLFLRHFPAEESSCADISFTAIKNDDTEFSAHLSLSPSTFDGETCAQIIIHSGDGLAPGAGNSSVDSITGLPSRSFLENQITTTCIQTSKGMSPASLLFINIDHFSDLRVKLGISGCDMVIHNLAELLKQELPQEHCLARFGDSSLGLLLVDHNSEAALAYATSCCQKVEENICEINSQTLQFTCSIGISPLASYEVSEIIDNAFTAILQLYENGENNCAKGFEQTDTPSTQITPEQAASFEEALEKNRFRLLFQPIISLRGDSLEHYEVFLRMLNSNDEEIPPAEFIHNATDTKMDRWVILEATKALSMHRLEGHETRLIINLTANIFQDNEFITWISVSLKAANLPTDCVIFQFSEEDIANNLNQAKEVTQALNNLNIKVSITGFGKSTDPTKTFKHVTAEYVKIDGSFTMALQENQSDSQVMKALVNTLSESGLISIVPCVENAGVLATLWQLGVNYIQGHYLQPPTPTMNYEFTDIA